MTAFFLKSKNVVQVYTPIIDDWLNYLPEQCLPIENALANRILQSKRIASNTLV